MSGSTPSSALLGLPTPPKTPQGPPVPNLSSSKNERFHIANVHPLDGVDGEGASLDDPYKGKLPKRSGWTWVAGLVLVLGIATLVGSLSLGLSSNSLTKPLLGLSTSEFIAIPVAGGVAALAGGAALLILNRHHKVADANQRLVLDQIVGHVALPDDVQLRRRRGRNLDHVRFTVPGQPQSSPSPAPKEGNDKNRLSAIYPRTREQPSAPVTRRLTLEEQHAAWKASFTANIGSLQAGMNKLQAGIDTVRADIHRDWATLTHLQASASTEPDISGDKVARIDELPTPVSEDEAGDPSQPLIPGQSPRSASPEVEIPGLQEVFLNGE